MLTERKDQLNNLNQNSPILKSLNYEEAWVSVAKEIGSRSLSGLQLQCPECRKIGSLFSMWERGNSIKPLYVVHTNGNGYFKACLLDKEQANSARQQIKITSRETIKSLRFGKPFVLFSGGRDSLCTLEYMKRLSIRSGIDITALHVDTTAGFPEVEEFVVKACKKMKVPLVTVRPEYEFFDIAKRWGIPGHKSRWCCKTLKIYPIKKFLRELGEPAVIYDGIRAAESPLRATYVPIWYHPSFRSICVSPIFYWSDAQIEKYMQKNNLPKSPAYELGTSGECWCGAYKGRSDFEQLWDVHPDIFKKLVKVEEAQKGKYTFIYEKGQRIPLKSIIPANK